jgi:hypothetical protein
MRPHKSRPYFLCDPEGDGFQFFSTEEDRDTAAKIAIGEYLQSGEWISGVELICVGKITHECKMKNAIFRPDEVDENGHGSDGEDWSGVDIKCDYELSAL